MNGSVCERLSVASLTSSTALLLLLPGLLPSHVPPVDFSAEDYSTSHDAVGSTPPLPSASSDTWYRWYGTMEPDESEVARVKKTYAAYLK